MAITSWGPDSPADFACQSRGGSRPPGPPKWASGHEFKEQILKLGPPWGEIFGVTPNMIHLGPQFKDCFIKFMAGGPFGGVRGAGAPPGFKED